MTVQTFTLDEKTSIHEAGHAVVLVALGLDMERVTIDREGERVAHVVGVAHPTVETPHFPTQGERKNYSNIARYILAGGHAERLYFGEGYNAGDSDDISWVQEHAWHIYNAAIDRLSWEDMQIKASKADVERCMPAVLELAAELRTHRQRHKADVQAIVHRHGFAGRLAESDFPLRSVTPSALTHSDGATSA